MQNEHEITLGQVGMLLTVNPVELVCDRPADLMRPGETEWLKVMVDPIHHPILWWEQVQGLDLSDAPVDLIGIEEAYTQMIGVRLDAEQYATLRRAVKERWVKGSIHTVQIEEGEQDE